MLLGLDNEYFNVGSKDIAVAVIKAIGVVLILDYFFYKSVWALPFLLPVGIMYFRKELKDLKIKLQHEGRNQFKELLLLSSTNMRAGYSVENAFVVSYEDVKNLYGKDCLICRLLQKIYNQKANNKSFESVFIEAGKLTGIKEIESFGQLYEIAYQKSGNLSLVMDKAAGSIIENMETENEIYASLCERQFEMKIMNLMPLIIMFYINLTNNGYFDRMYHNVMGIVVMSVCLGFYVLSYVGGYKIMDIRV